MKLLNYFNFHVDFCHKSLPKIDYLNYCQDLARQESGVISKTDCFYPRAFSFSDLFNLTIAKNRLCLNILESVSITILAHAFPEYDPDFTHLGVYLKNKYNFRCEFIDVIACNESAYNIAYTLVSNLIAELQNPNGIIILFTQPISPVSCWGFIPRYEDPGVEVFHFSKNIW